MTIKKFKSKDEMQVWRGTCRKNLELLCLAIVVTNRFWCSKLAQNSNQKHPCQLRKISLALILQSWFCYSVSTGQDLLAWRQCKHHLLHQHYFFNVQRLFLPCLHWTKSSECWQTILLLQLTVPTLQWDKLWLHWLGLIKYFHGSFNHWYCYHKYSDVDNVFFTINTIQLQIGWIPIRVLLFCLPNSPWRIWYFSLFFSFAWEPFYPLFHTGFMVYYRQVCIYMVLFVTDSFKTQKLWTVENFCRVTMHMKQELAAYRHPWVQLSH